jgi:hypothetical protein
MVTHRGAPSELVRDAAGHHLHDGRAWCKTCALYGKDCPDAGERWQADHIVPMAEGGYGYDLDAYRTLCVPCHKQVTAEQTHRRTTARR